MKNPITKPRKRAPRTRAAKPAAKSRIHKLATHSGLYRPTNVTPEEFFVALGKLREKAADEVERLLELIDRIDGDHDLEPSLSGYSDGMDDREGECEDEGAQCDDEGDISDSGVADFDGLMEQWPAQFAHCNVRVEQ